MADQKLVAIGTAIVEALAEEDAPPEGVPAGYLYAVLGCGDLIGLAEFNALGRALEKAGLIEVTPGPRWKATDKARELLKQEVVA